MFGKLFTNDLPVFRPARRPKNFVRLMLVWAVCETIISTAVLLAGGHWWNWLGFLTWLIYGVSYKLYKNHVAYGMTPVQVSTWEALLELTEPTQHRSGIDKKMICHMDTETCYAVRKELWELRRAELENIKVASRYEDTKTLLTTRVQDATMEVRESTATMRELMSREPNDDIDRALAESEAVSEA